MPHGCAGSPTVKIRVQIPEGVIAVKPMPKAGWNVESSRANMPASTTITATSSPGVKEVVWSGGKLPDHNYDEFVISTLPHRQPEAQHHAVFPGGAGMREGVSRWIEIPAEGAGHSHEDKSPAPGVKLMPKP